MKYLLYSFLFVFTAASAVAQQNIHFKNQTLADILEGNYEPDDYNSSSEATDPYQIAEEISDKINPDSLHRYLLRMSQFETRHTSSDTISDTRGFGAARRWAHRMFEKFDQENNDRLEVSFLQFDQNICGVNRHKNIVAVLPGLQLEDEKQEQSGIVIIEGHLDSRCSGGCDTNCVAEGMEDNGSGSALVMELARVMSQYQFNRTILFMLTTGEEQGLHGADALSTYCTQNNIPVAAVLNNDVIGGIICGETSSAPSCPGLNDVDSTQVRLFSSGTFSSPHKQLVRYIKLQYEEQLKQHVDVEQTLTVMTAEDRTGRGGDHIPFRQRGYPAMRFTSANEHGDASNGPEYDDRQHTSDDILGVDTDNNGTIDSFFVDFNYLARNAAINANAAAFVAQNVCNDVVLDLTQVNWRDMRIEIEGEGCIDPPFRIALRSLDNDWDTLITTNSQDTTIVIPELGRDYFVSACRVNENGVESLFSGEEFIRVNGQNEVKKEEGIMLMQNRPNPFDETTAITFMVNDMPSVAEAHVRITDINGRVIKEMRKPIQPGMNELIYDHGYGKVGTYYYSLIIAGEVIDTKKMVFVAY